MIIVFLPFGGILLMDVTKRGKVITVKALKSVNIRDFFDVHLFLLIFKMNCGIWIYILDIGMMK